MKTDTLTQVELSELAGLVLGKVGELSADIPRLTAYGHVRLARLTQLYHKLNDAEAALVPATTEQPKFTEGVA